MSRKAGILLPIFSLPSHYGIGTLGQEAYSWIDFLHSAHQKLGRSCLLAQRAMVTALIKVSPLLQGIPILLIWIFCVRRTF